MDAETPSPAVTPARSRGRPPKAQTESPAARVARLQRELEAAQAVLRAEAEKQFRIVGRVVCARAEKDDAFRRQIAELLQAGLRRNDELAAIAPLLVAKQ